MVNAVRRIFLTGLFLLSMQNFLCAVEPVKSGVDELAADFTLPDLENKEVSLSDFKGRPVILFFWATWCPHCRGELKTLNDEYEKIRNDAVELLGISTGETRFKVDNFTKTYHLAFRILLDEDTQVAQSYDIIGVPTFIFIDKQGRIVYRGHRFERKTYNQLISQ